MEMDPGDDRVKIAFAEMSVKVDTLYDITVRGRKARIHLYEIEGIGTPSKTRIKFRHHFIMTIVNEWKAF